MSRHALVALVLAVAAAAGGCRKSEAPAAEKHYELRGQVLDVRKDVGEIRIRHERIPGYMEAMTMSFGVKDRALLEGRVAGDLVRGTLTVTDTDAWLSALEKTGFAAVQADAEEPSGPAPAFTLLEPGAAVPDETFVDQDGAAWRPSSLAGRAYALTFIYTRCPLPTYCPLMDRHFRAAQQAIAARPALRGRVHLVTVTFDPEFDTPQVLRQHARSIGASLDSWTFVTGDRAAVEAFAAKFGVSVIRERADSFEITHNLRTAVVSPAGKVVQIHSGNEWTPGQLVADLEAAAAR